MWTNTRKQRLEDALQQAIRLRVGTSKLIDNLDALEQHHGVPYPSEIMRLRERWKEEAKLVALLERDVANNSHRD